MINFDDYTNGNKRKHKPNWPYIPDHPYRILGYIMYSFLGLRIPRNKYIIKFNKIHLYAKDPYEDKYRFLINKRESMGLKHFNNPKAFIEYSNDMHDV